MAPAKTVPTSHAAFSSSAASFHPCDAKPIPFTFLARALRDLTFSENTPSISATKLALPNIFPFVICAIRPIIHPSMRGLSPLERPRTESSHSRQRIANAFPLFAAPVLFAIE